MRFIDKSSSPAVFETWKLENPRAAYSDLNKSRNGYIKSLLRNSLSDEQLGLCCYCGISLDGNIHIEHFMPQTRFRAKQLDYSNLHASCMGKEIHPNASDELTFCGHSKGNWYDAALTISPMDPECESYFKYGYEGTIESTGLHPGGNMTIEKFGLDTYLLNRLREEAINAMLENIDFSNQQDIDKWVDFLQNPNSKGELPSFSFVLLSIIKSLS